MKILLFADLHMCPRASIINKWGTKYTNRLENCIESVNWLEQLAEEQNCDCVINLGDFFDKPDLTSETITACKELKWSNKIHYNLVGNHDASNSDLTFNSVNCFLGEQHKIITEPQTVSLEDCELCFLPYVAECNRKPIKEYFGDPNPVKPRIILSHNDIKGIQLGPIVSKTGFTMEEIEANCSVFFNGHLHNGQMLSQKIINLGNLTGKDFGENAFKYAHTVAIIDTKTLEITYIENPFAFNFYKLQINTEADLELLHNLKTRSVISIKCDSTLIEQAKRVVADLSDNIIESRFIIVRQQEALLDSPEMDLSVDHLARFIECCKANIENNMILEEEIAEVCK